MGWSIRVFLWHVSEEMNITTEWVLMFEQLVAISVCCDGAGLPMLVLLGVFMGHHLLAVPANLLGGRLLPLAALLWNALVIHNPLLHRLDFEYSINSGRVILRDA